MNTNDAEIDHLTGWSIWDWILNTVLIFGWVFVTLIVVAAAFAVAAWLMDVSDHVRWSSIVMGAVAVAVVLIGGFASVAGVLLSLNKFYEQTFEVLRHATSWGWSLLTALLVIAVLIGGVVAVYRWLARSMDRWAVLIPSPWILAVALAFVVDCVHRVAASMDTTLAGLGGIALLAIAFGAFLVFSRR
jgi:hypothetical protein